MQSCAKGCGELVHAVGTQPQYCQDVSFPTVVLRSHTSPAKHPIDLLWDIMNIFYMRKQKTQVSAGGGNKAEEQ